MSNPLSIFREILKVPRPSKHEEQICAWVLNFAKQHNLEYEFLPINDNKALGNIILRKPATKGYENKEGLILQAHLDMVCEKNSDVEHNFMTDPIETYEQDGWLRAKGTTLGADNGIGIAMALAALTDDELQHPELEALFTLDEETGLTGANLLEEGHLHGKRLLNLDSEDDGQIFIGCAGGIDTLAKLYYEPLQLAEHSENSEYSETSESSLFPAEIKIAGLMGGHSGDDINKGRGNANKLLVRFLFMLHKELGADLHLAAINGGNLRNAIAREAGATICVPMSYKETLRIRFNEFVAMMEDELLEIEKDMRLSLESCELPNTIIPHDKAEKLILALYACPHGVIAMSKDMPGLVETSTNLASVKMKEGYIEINTSQRSSIESCKHNIKNQVECALALSGAEVTHGDGYPGWKPNTKSPLLEVAIQTYETLTNEKPAVKAIHAGLECGLFLEKYPYLDMISIGPQMTGVHSPQEQLNLASTEKTWQWLKAIIRNA